MEVSLHSQATVGTGDYAGTERFARSSGRRPTAEETYD